VTLTHPSILETRRLAWSDEAGCRAWARALAARPGIGGATIELRGPLGAGKTTVARHLLRALGVEGRIKSPTYAVMEPYELPGGGLATHFDFYRFDDPREWLDAGFRDIYAGPGLKLAEWPERAGEMLPLPDLRLWIDVQDDGSREVTVQALSERGVGLIA